MSTRILLALVTYTLLGGIGRCMDAASAMDAPSAVKAFLAAMNRQGGPRLSDYYRFIGGSDDRELRLELMECKKKGWNPPESSTECVAYTRGRAETPTRSKSLYLSWLRGKLPPGDTVEVQTVDKSERSGEIPHEIVHARIGHVKVEFYRQLDKTGPSGLLDVRAIDGVDVADMFAKETNKPQ